MFIVSKNVQHNFTLGSRSDNIQKIETARRSKIDGILRLAPISTIYHDANDKEKKMKSRRQPTDAESDPRERENGRDGGDTIWQHWVDGSQY